MMAMSPKPILLERKQHFETVQSFKYLGRILEENDGDLPAVEGNLHRARQRWGMIARILSQEGTNAKVMATFYKAVVQSVLLYGSESWVLSEKMMSSLRSFHRRHIKKNPVGSWSYPGSKD
jgi:hypothetical protein